MLAENLTAALDFFKTKSPSLIGVDIASTSLKLVELSEAGKGTYRLERYAIEPLPKDTVTDGNIANLDQVSDALKRAWKRLGSRNRHRGAWRCPPPWSSPRRSSSRPARRKRSSNSPSRPRPTSTFRSRSTRSTSTSRSSGPAPNNPDEVEVLIAASRKEKVEDRVAIAEAAGLKPRVMDVESYATQEAFRLIAPVAAGQRPRPEHRAGRHRRPRHPLLCPAQQPVPVLPRPGVRRQPADPGHPARVQPVRRGSRVRQAEPGPARELRQRRAAAVHGDARAGDHARAAVLLHVDVVQPGRPDRAGRRLRAAARASTSSSPSAPAWRRSSPTRSRTCRRPTASGRASSRRTRRC